MAKLAVILDSNVWISYFNQTDTNHKKAVLILAQQTENQIILTEYILLEISTILKRQLGYLKAQKIITALLQTENIDLILSDQFFEKTLKVFLGQKDQHLSFVDVSLSVLSADFLVETFDKKLKQSIKK